LSTTAAAAAPVATVKVVAREWLPEASEFPRPVDMPEREGRG
jgi:hypothetical protein